MLQKLLIDDTTDILIQLFRYTFVGGVAFLGDFAMLFIMTDYIHIHYLISAAIAFLFGLIINYFLSIKWIFSSSKLSSRHIEFIIYAFIGIIGLGINEILMWFFTDKIKLFYLLSKLGSTCIVYMWNFFARRFILFG